MDQSHQKTAGSAAYYTKTPCIYSLNLSKTVKNTFLLALRANHDSIEIPMVEMWRFTWQFHLDTKNSKEHPDLRR